MLLSIIAAIGKNNELGKNNDLIWHFKDDMRFFKALTMGNTVIMGRKTFESMPKALPHRRNIVITSDGSYIAENAETVNSVEAALKAASDDDNVFIIGGGRVYAETVSLADRLYITEINGECADADVFFPAFDKEKYERIAINKFESEGTEFSHILYKLK